MRALMGIRLFDGTVAPSRDAPFVAVAFGRGVTAIEHEDPDADLGMLICVDVDDVAGVLDGNGFTFGDAGVHVAMKHGDVLLFNPKERHAVTEAFYKAAPPVGAPVPYRTIMSLYLKEKHLKNTACRPPSKDEPPLAL